MKISIAQQNYTVGDFEGNATKIIDAIIRAKNEDSQLIVFPEMALCGAPTFDLPNSIAFVETCQETLQRIAFHTQGITAIVGIPLHHKRQLLNTVAVLQDGKITNYIGKHNVRNHIESYRIEPSKGCEYIAVGDKHVAVVIGDDLFDEMEYGEKADLIVNCINSVYRRAIIESRYDTYSHKAFACKKPLAMVNMVGGNTDIVFDGTSAIFDQHGNSIAVLNSFEEDFITIDPFIPQPHVALLSKNKTVNVYRAIKLSLKDFFSKNGFKSCCLGLSGGIDSAVVAALCAETLGAENVRGLLMPSQYSSDHSVTDAVKLAENLRIAYDIVPIEPIYAAAHQSLAELFAERAFDVTEENMQSRIRGMLLMATSNKFKCILLNTTNKSEAAVGYGTLYGDTNGSFSILGDLYKTEVYDLARYINREHEIIPQNTIDKAPSAELRPDQKDTDSLPDYEVLDSILYRLIEQNQTVEEIADAGFEQKEVQRVLTLLRSAAYKRKQFCPVLKLSTCTMGVDWQLPLTCKYQY